MPLGARPALGPALPLPVESSDYYQTRATRPARPTGGRCRGSNLPGDAPCPKSRSVLLHLRSHRNHGRRRGGGRPLHRRQRRCEAGAGNGARGHRRAGPLQSWTRRRRWLPWPTWSTTMRSSWAARPASAACLADGQLLRPGGRAVGAGALNGKVGGAFTSTATQHGGREVTLFSVITNLLHFGDGHRRPALQLPGGR